MYLDVSKLKVETLRVERGFGPSELEFDYRDYALQGECRLEAEVTKNSREEVAIRGRVSGCLRVVCDRCLEPFDLNVEQAFSQFLIPVRPGRQEAETALDEEKLDESFYSDPKLSLTGIANEQLILALPAKVLCREDCAGLCATCGANLNGGACGCRERKSDPRWMLLREIQRRKK